MGTETFWVEPSGMVRLALRRWSRGEGECVGGRTYHDAEVAMGQAPAAEDADGYLVGLQHHGGEDTWPTTCERCTYEFTEEDGRTVRQERLYRRPDGSEEWAQRELPPGAMFDATWLPDAWKGPDGIGLIVILPTPDRHPWHVDAESSNCTRKGDASHKCWVRHGDPRTDRLTVDKNGETCLAGAGSIAVEGYHGFLRDGVLT